MTKIMKKTRRRQGPALGTALAARPPGLILASTGPAPVARLLCGCGQCIDEHQPAAAVRLHGSPGPASGDLLMDVLAPNNELRSGESA